MNKKFTSIEKRWILYDVGNSAFVMLCSTLLPIYFNYLASAAGVSSVNYLAYWGYTASAVTIIVAILGPISGTVSDYKGYKKPFFLASILLGCIGCLVLGLTRHWLLFLVVFIIAKLGFNVSLIFYDSMLSDITTEDRMDEVSSAGYAYGYIGSCIPFVICLILVLSYKSLGISFQTAMTLDLLITALWWFIMSLPYLKKYRQIHYVNRQPHALRAGLRSILDIFKTARQHKKILLFLVAFFFYIDGVYTIIDMATAYGTALGLDSTGLLLALLLTQIVAFPCAIIFGMLSRKYSGGRLLIISIIAYLFITIYAVFLKSQWQFWLLAIFVGMFQGGIQALSRSYYTKIIPSEQAGEYFGLMDICGKGASFVGTSLVGFISQITGSVNMGVGALVIMFAFGIIFFIISEKTGD